MMAYLKLMNRNTRGMNPKPAYYALNNLINKEWKTVLTQNASADGTVKFRGFYGDYDLKIHAGDKTIPVDYRLSKTAQNNIEIVI